MDTIASRIMRSRKAAGLSQHRLAVALDLTGQTIAAWEHGRAEPRATEVANLARATGVSAAWLLTGEGIGPVQVTVGQ
jgi:transcriptional regulator with XRE-family HTH domain